MKLVARPCCRISHTLLPDLVAKNTSNKALVAKNKQKHQNLVAKNKQKHQNLVAKFCLGPDPCCMTLLHLRLALAQLPSSTLVA